MSSTNEKTQAGTDNENIDRIREILFGAKAHQIEDEIKRGMEKVGREGEERSRLLNERMETFETFVRQELKSLLENIHTEQRLRQEMHDLILARTKALNEEIHRVQVSMAGEVNREVQSLDDNKVDRGQMADFLVEWASHLKSESGALRH